MSPKNLVIAAFIFAICVAGCGAPPAAQQAVPNQAGTSLPPTDTPVPTNTATATIDAAATQMFQQTADALATKNAVATGVSATRTADQAEKIANRQTATAAVVATADAQKSAYLARIKSLFEEGKVTTTDGEYVSLGDFEISQAQINTPFVYYLDYDLNNFVISAEMQWVSASENANWPTSGCGFVYGYKDSHNADLTFLGLDGYTHSIQYREKQYPKIFAFKKWGDPDRPSGKATAQLVVFDKRVSVYVNGSLANEFYNGLYGGGEIGLNIFSGTNKGYGTRCIFQNVELFFFE